MSVKIYKRIQEHKRELRRLDRIYQKTNVEGLKKMIRNERKQNELTVHCTLGDILKEDYLTEEKK